MRRYAGRSCIRLRRIGSACRPRYAPPRGSFQPKRLSAAKPTDSDVPPKLLQELLESIPRVTWRRISTVAVAGYAVNRGSWKRTGLPNQDIGPCRQFSCPIPTLNGGWRGPLTGHRANVRFRAWCQRGGPTHCGGWECPQPVRIYWMRGPARTKKGGDPSGSPPLDFSRAVNQTS
jgi:hypothetical protein